MEADVADPFSVCNILAFRELKLLGEKDGSGAGDAFDFRAGCIPHSLVLEQDQIPAAGPLRSLSREGCFPAAS